MTQGKPANKSAFLSMFKRDIFSSLSLFLISFVLSFFLISSSSLFIDLIFQFSFSSKVRLEYYNQVMKEYHHFPIRIYYLSPIIQADHIDPFIYDIKMSRFSINFGRSKMYTQTLKTIKVITDKSIWPYISDIYEEQNYSPDSIIEM